MTKLRIRNLPGVLADVQRLCGDATAVRFASVFGDSRLHIPRPNRLRDDHPLVRAVGRQAARVIAARLGGLDYTVPTGRHSINHHNVRLLRLNGWKTRAIARALMLREETVANLTDDLAPDHDDPQPVTLRCPCCGRVYKLTPAENAHSGTAPAEPEDDETFTARQPPLIRFAIQAGAVSLHDLRRSERGDG